MNPQRTTTRAARSLAPALLLFAFTLVSGACVSKPRGQAQNTYLGGEGLEMETLVGNRGLEGDLKVLRPLSERRDGRLHVQFELHNRRTSDFSFEYAVTWLDASGFVIDTPWRWSPMTIAGQGYRTVSITGPTPEASQWKLHVQKPSSVR